MSPEPAFAANKPTRFAIANRLREFITHDMPWSPKQALAQLQLGPFPIGEHGRHTHDVVFAAAEKAVRDEVPPAEELVACQAIVLQNHNVAVEVEGFIATASNDWERLSRLKDWARIAVQQRPTRLEDFVPWVELQLPTKRPWEDSLASVDLGSTVLTKEAQELACELIDVATLFQIRLTNIIRPSAKISYDEARAIGDTLIRAADTLLPLHRPPSDFTTAKAVKNSFSPADVDRLHTAMFLWGLLSLKEAALPQDAGLARETLRHVHAGIADSVELRSMIDAAGRGWEHSTERAHSPELSREGLQLLTVLRWAERIIDAPPRRRCDFEFWCNCKVFRAPFTTARPDEESREREYGHALVANQLIDAAVGLGIRVRPAFGPMTFAELRELAAWLCEEMRTASIENVPAVPDAMPTPIVKPLPAQALTTDEKILRAVVLRQKNLTWTGKRIAEEVGLSQSTLSRSIIWKRANVCEIAKLPPRGRRHADGNIEATDAA